MRTHTNNKMKNCLLLLCLVFLTSEAKPYSETWEARNSSDDLWSDCTKAGDHGKIISIVIDPNPPQIGSDVSIIANVSVDEELTSGTIMATIQLGPFPYQQKFDLCELLSEVNTTCPVQKGPLNVTVKTKIPDGTPPGTYSGQAVATDQNGETVFCVKVKLNL